MSAASRFQIHSTHARQGDIVTSVGVDPLTGLPVLIYEFAGRPTVGEGVLESENIPGILLADSDGDQGRLVTAYSRDYELVAPGEAALTTAFVIEAARALRDAAAAGVVHGDLRPGRFLHADGHVLIEGYGVPWSARTRDFTAPEYDGEASYAGDVYSFAKALLHLGRNVLSSDAIAVLNKALLPNAEVRPSADELYAMLERVGRAEAAAPPTETAPDAATAGTAPRAAAPERSEPVLVRGFEGITLTTDEEADTPADRAPPSDAAGELDDLHADRASRSSSDFELDFDFDLDALDTPPPEAPAPAPAAPKTPPAEVAGDSSGADPAPIEIATDPDRDSMRLRPKETHKDRTGFVKELPPGATYRAGDLSESAPPAAFTFEEGPAETTQRRRLGRFLLLSLVLIAVTVAAALLLPRQRSFVGPNQQPIYYTVSIGVDPPSVPRLDLVTVRSPAASSFGPGDILDTVPGQVLLDAEGVWVLQGRFQGRLTDPVELEVPAQRSATLVLPAPEDEERSLP